MKRIRLGTRGSRLARAQTARVARRLEELGEVEPEIVEIRTTGDRLADVPLGPDVGQAFFTKEIEEALLGDRIDVAVHSCKDLATALPKGLVLAAIPERVDPRDALVARDGLSWTTLPAGARVGTGSVRRRAFLSTDRPDVELVELRGNVPTRVAAVDEGRFDAVVLAVAGLERLDLGDRISDVLDPDLLPPAAGQGALALQTRAAGPARDLVARLDDPRAHAAVAAERSCLGRLGAGCQAPVGAFAEVEGDELRLRLSVVGPEGRLDERESGPASTAVALGRRAAERVLERLGLGSLREARSWAGPPPRGRP